MSLNQIESEIVKAYRANPNLWVYIRADKSAPWERVFNVIDLCTRNGIKQYSFRTEPSDRHR